MLYSKITDTEKELIIRHIENYANLNPNRPMADLKDILKVWNTEKTFIYHLFGDQLIHEIPVTINMSKDTLRREIQNFKHNNSFICTIADKYSKYIKENYCNKYYTECYPSAVFDTEYLMNNKILDDFTIDINGKMKKIQAGTRPMKVIKMLCEFLYVDMEEYEKFRIIHSQILNTKTLSGTLCLSIHPLDFMTMSDNKENWSSCMSWRDSGGYCRGTVECMNSPSLFVAYLKSDVNTFNGWNSKKWRSLFAITPDMVTSIKGYPYQNKDLVDIVLNKIYELSNGKYYKEILSHDGETIDIPLEYRNNFHTLRDDIGIDIHYQLVMYNDFGSCKHYCLISPNLIDKARSENTIDIDIGGDTTCMQCGEINAKYWHEGKLVCMDCADMITCAICGSQIERAYALETPEGELICECCYEDNYTTVQIPNGFVVPIENAVKIRMIPDGYTFPEIQNIYPTIPTIKIQKELWINEPELWNQYFTIDKPVEVIGYWGTINYCVYWSQCKEEVFEKLYYFPKEEREDYLNDLPSHLQK